MLINEGMPAFIVEQLSIKYNLKDKVVGILGMAFKAESDDSKILPFLQIKKDVRYLIKKINLFR